MEKISIICKKIVNGKGKKHEKNFKKVIYSDQKTSERVMEFTYVKEKIKIILKI